MIIFGLETLVVYFIMVFKLNIELLQAKFEKHQVLMKTRLIWAREKKTLTAKSEEIVYYEISSYYYQFLP